MDEFLRSVPVNISDIDRKICLVVGTFSDRQIEFAVNTLQAKVLRIEKEHHQTTMIFCNVV
jgi:hypothetical protein